MLNRNNTYFENLKRIGHEYEAARAERQARKQPIIDTYGWDSEELKAWYAEDEAAKFPFVLRTPHGQPHITARTSINVGACTDLPPITWHWDISAHHPSNWQSISLLLAGPEAKILGLRLKWRPDGTQLILR